MSKGSKQRPTDKSSYDSNYDAIFRGVKLDYSVEKLAGRLRKRIIHPNSDRYPFPPEMQAKEDAGYQWTLKDIQACFAVPVTVDTENYDEWHYRTSRS